MDHIKRRDSELVYISDDAVFEEQKKARRLTQRLNTMDRSDFDGIKELVKELLGRSDNAFINPPFYCDYGSHIETGKNFFANYNCTILDVGRVRIGDNTVIGAGSVVTRDIPAWTVAAGNPCRVIRRITEADRPKYFGGRRIDDEALEHIRRIQEEEKDPGKFPVSPDEC